MNRKSKEAFKYPTLQQEPLPELIQKYMQDNPGLGFYASRERLREQAYGGKAPNGFQSWGDYWKTY